MMRKRKDEKDMSNVPDLAHVFPLPVRVLPEPWEDLASLLSRTAVQMGYKQVNWLLRPEDQKMVPIADSILLCVYCVRMQPINILSTSSS